LTIWSSLERRFALLKEIVKIKADYEIPVLDEKREQNVLDKIAALKCEPEVSKAIAKLYKLLFELSRKYQGE
jgi:chorismate mutase